MIRTRPSRPRRRQQQQWRRLLLRRRDGGSDDDDDDDPPVSQQQQVGPREISGITLNSTAPGATTITWDIPSEAPVDYRVSRAKAGDPYLTWTDLTGNAFPAEPSRTITGLEEDEEYKVKIRARYDGGGGGGGGGPGDWGVEATIRVAGAWSG